MSSTHWVILLASFLLLFFPFDAERMDWGDDSKFGVVSNLGGAGLVLILRIAAGLVIMMTLWSAYA